MKIINNIKQIYKLGLRWSTLEFEDELFAQVWYIALILAEIAVLWNVNYPNALICTCMIFIHLLYMYALGYKKQLWEGSILEGSHKEEYYRKIYFILNIVLCILTMALTKSFIPLFLILIPSIGTVFMACLHMFFSSLIIRMINAIKKCKTYASEQIISCITYYVLAILPVVISMSLLPILIVWKLLIFVTFIVSIPLIVVGADNGMNFFDLFFVMK